jgi:beta-lactamase regulating signal transducer with metallopeptidase domain
MDLSLFPDHFDSFAAFAAASVLTSLWQGAVVALGVAAFVRLTPRLSSAQRFALWAAGFAVLVSLPFLPLFPAAVQASSTAGVQASTGTPSLKPWLELGLAWSRAIAVLWMVGSVLRAADLLIHTFRLRRLWKSAVPLESRNDGRRTAHVCTTTELDRPSVIGFFAPRILIPEWLYARLSADQLDQIVLHEFEHLRRRDDWTNVIQKLCLVFFPLHPALWWIERLLCKQREMACDEGVIRITNAPRAYAMCLTSLAEHGVQRRNAALSLGAWQRRPELVDRVHRILRPSKVLHPVASGALFAALGGGLLATSVQLARCPQLVAFVRPEKTESAAARPGRTHADRTNAFGAAFTPVSLSGSARPPFYAVETKAVMAPMPERTDQSVDRSETKGLPGHRQAVKANATATKTKQAIEPQFIVFTSWEQEERTPIVSQSEASENSQADERSKWNRPETGRVTVTRLIFRVLQTNSKSTQPNAVPLRNGWLVIQL